MADDDSKVIRLVPPPAASDGFKVDHGEMLDEARKHPFRTLAIIGMLEDGQLYMACSDGGEQMLFDMERARFDMMADIHNRAAAKREET